MSSDSGTGTNPEDHAEKTEILLVEDHSSFRQALAFMLESEPGFVVKAQAGTLAQARVAIEEFDGEFDVAVVDLALPDGDGDELIRELHVGKRNVMVLVLSASVDNSRFASAVEAGAAGVLHKSADIQEIADAVRRLKAGEALLTQTEVISMLRVASSNRLREQEARRSIELLTSREKQVLAALAEGLDSKEIAQKLHITYETERTHVVNIMKKLGAHSRLQAVVFAARYGLVEFR